MHQQISNGYSFDCLASQRVLYINMNEISIDGHILWNCCLLVQMINAKKIH